ncbi:MAG: hypothetical protein R2771_02025 [Saprospiraceae bacterium]
MYILGKRKKIEGVGKIFAYSVKIHGNESKDKKMLSDTTVQENNTTFPTNTKLVKQIIDKCNKIALEQGVIQRQTYSRISKQLMRDSYNAKHPKKVKKKPRNHKRN